MTEDIQKLHQGIPQLAAYELIDSVQGGTIIVTTLDQQRLMSLIKRARDVLAAGWTEEELLTELVRLDPHRVRVMRTYSTESIQPEDRGEHLLLVDGQIVINRDVKIDRYEESIQRLAETDSLAHSIALQAKRHKEEKEAKPKFDVKRIFIASKAEDNGEKPTEAKKVVTIKAVPCVPKAVKIAGKSIEAVQVIEKTRESVLDRTVKAVKKMFDGDEHD